jgi:hypothetical protein
MKTYTQTQKQKQNFNVKMQKLKGKRIVYLSLNLDTSPTFKNDVAMVAITHHLVST